MPSLLREKLSETVSFRIGEEELRELLQRAKPGEGANEAARRLLRATLERRRAKEKPTASSPKG